MNYLNYTGGGDYLAHHGISNQKWKVHNGPSLNAEGKTSFRELKNLRYQYNYYKNVFSHGQNLSLEEFVMLLDSQAYGF